MSRTIEPIPAWPEDPIDQMVWKLRNSRPNDRIFHCRREHLEAVQAMRRENRTLKKKLEAYEAG